MFRTLPYQMFAALAAACFAAATPAQQKFDVSEPWNATEFHSVNAQKFADRVKQATNGDFGAMTPIGAAASIAASTERGSSGTNDTVCVPANRASVART